MEGQGGIMVGDNDFLHGKQGKHGKQRNQEDQQRVSQLDEQALVIFES